MRPLTQQERAFVEGVMAGKSNAAAWRVAYPAAAATLAGDNRGIAEEARNVARRPAVMGALAALRFVVERKSEWTKAQAVARLKRAADSPKHPEATQAIAQASKMLGWDAPQKIEAKIEGSLWWQITHRAKTQITASPAQ
jgi:hypothetical protein